VYSDVFTSLTVKVIRELMCYHRVSIDVCSVEASSHLPSVEASSHLPWWHVLLLHCLANVIPWESDWLTLGNLWFPLGILYDI
jgi:hypothetical protein